ncbi:MAG: four helix bundle protein [Bacteroidia bacterium]
MKDNNIIRDKSYAFSIRVVNLYRFLCEEKKEFVLSKQLVRSGTSIGANIEEGIGGQSEKDFFAKLNIAYKEARETYYWLRLLKDTGYLSENESKSILEDCDELLKIIGSIIKTLKQKSIPNF